MHHHYKCIRSRIAEPPKWFDEDGVPRYEEFTPQQTANIYAREAVLLRIECQNCGHPFDVCMTTDMVTLAHKHPTLAEEIGVDGIHYGDPPNIECCPAGPTMSSVPRRVLQFWRQNAEMDWERVPELERVIACDWAEEWTS